MADPSLALQDAIVARIRDQVAGLSGRFYDQVPQNAVFPYGELGEFQTLDDSADCVDGAELMVTLHFWSRKVGQVEAKNLASAARTALHGFALDLGADWHVVLFEHRSTNILKDPDGVTTHAVFSGRSLIDAR